MEKTGDLFKIRGEVTVEWKIKDFFPLPQEKDKCHKSPTFYFCCSSWEVWLYPNGQTTDASKNYVSIYLHRTSSGSPVTVKSSFVIKDDENKVYKEKTYENVFDIRKTSWGYSKLMSNAHLTEKKLQLTASDDLIVIVTLKNSESNAMAGSLFSRLQKVSEDFKEIYLKAKKTDFQFNIDEQKLFAHRVILEARCPVLAAMLSHDTKESQNGELSITDMDRSTLEALLIYMYSGRIKNLTTGDALRLYTVAEKYDIKDLKEMCLQFIIRNLSIESVCDVIKFSEVYQDKEISRLARVYFKENADKILETANWETFVKEYHDISVELLATVVKKMFKK